MLLGRSRCRCWRSPGAGRARRGVALLALIAVYVPLAGAGPSLQRAGVMGAAGIAAMTASRPASRVVRAAAGRRGHARAQPARRGDPGWQLSFAAVAGILVLGRPPAALARAGGRSARRARRPGRCRGLADGIAITVAATLATAPLAGATTSARSRSPGWPANLLALPAVAPVMWLGMVKAALGTGGAAVAARRRRRGCGDRRARRGRRSPTWTSWRSAAPTCPARSCALPLRLALRWCGAYVLLALALQAGVVGLPAAAALGPAGVAERAASWRRASPSLRLGVALLVAGLLALAGAAVLGAPPPPGQLTVRVPRRRPGRRDAVQHPDGTAVLFDGGPPEGGVVRLLRRAGVQAARAWSWRPTPRATITAGWRRCWRATRSGCCSTAATAAAIRASPSARARRAGAASGRSPGIAPLSLAAGEPADRGALPAAAAGRPAPEDPNPRAVVAVVSAGAFDLLLSADAESEALLPLDLPDVEAMKVPHHGSADPGLPAVLERLRPEIAAIEVGPNTYGHPAPSTLAALERAGVTTYRTDRHGTVTLTVDGGAMRVTTEH